jgi:Kef-type K+ transport system membrane component KefB
MEYFIEHLISELNTPIRNPVLVFAIILFVILLAPILLKRLNIPGIIGLIIAGVLLGPKSLNVIENSEAIKLFSTIGLLYIMFIAGLELDLNDFRKYGNRSLTFGILTFIIPLGLGYPVVFYILGYEVNASFLTASMFATHTLVAYPIVSKFGIAKNQAVSVAVGGTIFTDTLVLLILAFIIAMHDGQLNSTFVIRLSISLLIFGLFMFLVIPPFARWFFNRLESEHHSHYIFVLAIVFFSAFLSQVAGVEPIIGSFVAGLALNKLIPHSSALMNRIEFIGNSLFIPFFLFSVGMVVDLQVLTHTKTWIVTGVLTTFALFSKWLAAFITQQLFKYSKPQRNLLFGLSSAHAAATLAIILIGYRKNILDEHILNGTIILILITCIFASFATESGAKEIAKSSANTVDDQDIEVEMLSEHIIIPIEANEDISKLVELATAIKNKRSAHPVTLLSVIDMDDKAEYNILKEQHRIQGFIAKASGNDIGLNIVSSIDHNLGTGIARKSREIMGNLILISWPKKSSIVDRFMGDRLDGILTHTEKSIFMCDINAPLISNKRMVVFLPALSEKENGFLQCMNKLFMLAKNYNLQIQLFSTEETFTEIKRLDKYLGYNIDIRKKTLEDWSDFLVVSRDIKKDDLIVVVSARKGSLSYSPLLDGIPDKLDKYFDQNKIILFPQSYSSAKSFEHYLDINAEPLSKGIRTLNKIKDIIVNK